jgi:predicted membrane channel-forming protein YqfA (hemolysin III family)
MNPVSYVRTHWHAMVLGAVAWHFIGPMVMPKAMSALGGGPQGS